MPGARETILVVDPCAETRQQMASLLGGMGYPVKPAADADAGLSSFMALHPAVTLIDVQMAAGAATAEKMRACGPDREIVAMAEAAAMTDVMDALKNRVGEFIRKPIVPVELEIVVQRCLERIDLRQCLKAAAQEPEIPPGQPGDGAAEKERLHFIKQIAKNLSAFMGQIGSDAQDGLRYFDEMPYFMAIHSADLKILAASPGYHTHFGNRIGQDSWAIYTGVQASRDDCPAGITRRTARAKTTRAEAVYHSGARVPLTVHTAPIFDGRGRIGLILEVIAGTREIETMARKIRTTQQRYRKLFDAVPNYIAVLDRQMRLAAFNRRFLEDFGFKTGRKFFDIFRPVGVSAEKGPIAGTLADGMPHQGEMALFAPGGEQLNLMSWTSPIETATGKLIQVLVIFTDITELRRMQGNLSQLGLMVSTVTHSLKGSLTGLDAGLYMIEKGFYRDRPGRIEEGLDVAKLMTDRIRKLVQDILYYAKKRDLETETVDAVHFAEDVAATIRPKITAANIAFRFETAAAAVDIDIDVGLIRASLINIMENAVEACIDDPSERPHWIELAVRGEDDHVVFTITDNGLGMTPEQIRDIFKLFWSSKGKAGTGLGLFITNRVVRKHGGKITVVSEPGHYTAFHVRLPRKISS